MVIQSRLREPRAIEEEKARVSRNITLSFVRSQRVKRSQSANDRRDATNFFSGLGI